MFSHILHGLLNSVKNKVTQLAFVLHCLRGCLRFSGSEWQTMSLRNRRIKSQKYYDAYFSRRLDQTHYQDSLKELITGNFGILEYIKFGEEVFVHYFYASNMLVRFFLCRMCLVKIILFFSYHQCDLEHYKMIKEICLLIGSKLIAPWELFRKITVFVLLGGILVTIIRGYHELCNVKITSSLWQVNCL